MKILRLWGIPIHKVLSDSEFVEKNRKWLRRSKKIAWIHVIVLILLSVFVTMVIDTVLQTEKESPDGIQRWIWLGLLLGFIFGAVMGQYVMLAAQSIFMALDLFDFNRGAILLIKYHEMLKETGILEPEDEQKDGQLSDTWPRQNPF